MELEVTSLALARGGLPILEQVSFRVRAGQALVLRGPNGCGKTTLLRCLAGLQPALAGQIHAPEEEIAYAAHADGIKATLTVRENLAFWAEIFGTRDISPALESFDLTGLQDRPAGMLSAGQKRRLGLARLVLTGRRIWLLDEPTVSLDQNAVALFARAVEHHLEQGGLAVIATHIDLGLSGAVLDLSAYKARVPELQDDALEGFL